MNRFWIENEVRTINALRRVERTESGFIVESKDGRIAFEDRRHRQKSPHTTSQATFSDANGAALVYSGLRELDSDQQLFHTFTARVQLFTVGALTTLWTLSSSGASSPAISPGETLIFWAEYPNPVSGTDAFGVDAWTTPVENTDYEANTQAGGGGTDRSASLTLTITKFGNSMKIAIENDHASDIVFLTLLKARGTPITKDDPAPITVEVSATHPRTFPDPPQFLPSIAAAFDWANWYKGVYSTIQPLYEMRSAANRTTGQAAKCLGLDISDRVTVVGTNDAGLGVNEDFFIESERHVIDPTHGTHWVTWGLSAVADQDAWTLGTSKLSSETRLAQ